MSILIKGLDMPTSCDKCQMPKEPNEDGTIWCIFARGYIGDDRTVCPLSYVPPHGDLIERKAVCLTDFEIAMCNGDYKEGMKMLLEKIESAPAIIPAEEGET